MSGRAEVEGLVLNWCGRTDVGKVRKVNEDSMIELPGLLVVADGMGGHAAGDVASRIVIETFASWMDGPGLLPISELSEVISLANTAVVKESHHSGREGMGSTVVGMAVVDNGGEAAVVVFHVGDSRCYRVVDGEVELITRDHSHVQELVDSGEITEAQAVHHPLRNVVTRAVGIDAVVAADYLVLPEVPHQRLFLCSDGISGEIEPERLNELMLLEQDPQLVVDAILAEVLAGRAADNATLVVVDVDHQALSSLADPDVTGPRRGIEVPRGSVTTDESAAPPEGLINSVPMVDSIVPPSSDSTTGELIDQVPG